MTSPVIIWRLPRIAGQSIHNGLDAMGSRPVGFRDFAPDAPVITAGHETPDRVVKAEWMTAEEILSCQNYICLRNVWDRIVSLFFLLHQRGKHSPELMKLATEEVQTFPQFVDWCTSPERERRYHRRNYQCQPLTDWLTVQGMPITFTLGWFTDLEHYWKAICEAVGCSGELPHHNASEHGHYRDYFHSEDVAKVAAFYAAEIDYCKWEF